MAPRWAGRCETCGEWNSIVEEAVEAGPGLAKAAGPAKPGASRKIAFVPLAGEAPPPARAPTGMAELDRVLGGGLVPGSAVLLGGRFLVVIVSACQFPLDNSCQNVHRLI